MTTFIESELSNRRPESGISDGNDKITWRTITRNNKWIPAFIFITLSISLPAIFYSLMFNEDISKNREFMCSIDKIYRISCVAENITEKECLEVLCCFDKHTNSCYHSEPSNYYYKRSKSGNYFVPSQKYTPLGFSSWKSLNIFMEEKSQILSIVISENSTLEKRAKHRNFSNFEVLESENDKLSVTVLRKGTNDVLLTTIKGPISFSKEYSELTIQLTNNSGTLFGLGELNIAINENTTLTKTIYKNENDHNTSPIFMAYKDEKYHAALVIHEGLLEITVLPSFIIVLRNIGGKNIQIKVVDGQTPRELYKKLIANRNVEESVPEWTLGVHLCRETPALNMEKVLEQYQTSISNRENRSYSYISDCIHDDLLLHLIHEDYTSKQIKEMFSNLQFKEKFMLSFPPQVPIDSSIFNNNKGIFLRNGSSEEFLVGKYKGFDVAYPDLKSQNIQDLVSEILSLFEDVPLGGVTFTNSWPQNDNYEVDISVRPYMNKNIATALSRTIPWDLEEHAEEHIRFHNNYGANLKNLIKNHLPEETFYLTPNSDMSTIEALIIQNVNISWANLKNAIRTNLYNSLFGNQMTSIPVCGSNDDYDEKLHEDLCLRWYLFSVTMPLLRISSTGTSRDPSSLNSLYASKKVVEILEKREQFIPYYRHIMKIGEPVARPMFFNFPNDANTLGLDEQYMIGDGILVVHILLPDVQELNIYLPPDKIWYELWGGLKYSTKKNEEWVKFSVVESDWVSFILEGNILPLVKKSDNEKPEINLVIAPRCTTECEANGFILLHYSGIDVPVEFSSVENEITINTERYADVKDMIKSVRFTKYKTDIPNDFIIK